ncbi:MAG TPA: acyl-CoA dehydrogenase [Chloroflexi bacterium]|nr:acyl-CoA dehydrogenase [Chloroflexota bacterium]
MIAFEPTDEQRLMVETVRQFAHEQMRERAHAADEARALPTDVIAGAWELGLIPSNIPEAYGGFGERHSALTGVLTAEALGEGDLAMALATLAPNLVAVPLLECGTEAQKETLLPRFTGDAPPRAAAALIEPTWNFDPCHLKTVAHRDGEHYVLTGRKAYVPLADQADLLLVYAHDAERDVPAAFFIQRNSEPPGGLGVGPREKLMGVQALPTFGLTLDEVSVPPAARLGGEKGFNLEKLLNYSRVALAALATGVGKAAYEYALNYAKEREAFGKPIAQFQAIAFMLAEMAIEVEAMQLHAWKAAWALDQGQAATQAAVLAKQYADEAVLTIADRAVQILGGHGYIREHPVERWLRDARGFATFTGLAMV